eukprot:TRINITY_DN6311_c1_g1_i1.p1 TRINITY_DN6311_c1_g1~~TRINITY_DN6311_c1_g1_i1.p1  ORF type:complete len:509 (+),score=79.28 TRINITY_DN6311_c1_g1_i1:216-1742(+)
MLVWIALLVLLGFLLRFLLNARPARGLLCAPKPHAKRVDNSFGLFDIWYASHPAPHQHSHTFIVSKTALVKDMRSSVLGVVRRLECLRVCLVPAEEVTGYKFGRLKPAVTEDPAQLPVFDVVGREWKDVLIESVDTTMMKPESFLWRLHVVPESDSDVAIILTFNHLVTDGNGSLAILSEFTKALLSPSEPVPLSQELVIPFGPPLEHVFETRPKVSYMLSRVLEDKTETFFPKPNKFPREETYKHFSELTTGMEFLEFDEFVTRHLLSRCKFHGVTLNALLCAAHMLAYTSHKHKTIPKDLSISDTVDIMCAVSLRKNLLIPMPEGCGGNYLTGTTFTRKIPVRNTELIKNGLDHSGTTAESKSFETLVWSLAKTVKKDYAKNLENNSTDIGLTAWIDEPVLRDWMLKKGVNHTFYGRTTVLGISNLTRVDSYFAPESDSTGLPASSPIKAMWFSQSNRDAFGPLLECCIETFQDKLRIVCCYTKPAFTAEDTKDFLAKLSILLKRL